MIKDNLMQFYAWNKSKDFIIKIAILSKCHKWSKLVHTDSSVHFFTICTYHEFHKLYYIIALICTVTLLRMHKSQYVECVIIAYFLKTLVANSYLLHQHIDGHWYLYIYRLLSFQNNRLTARSRFHELVPSL